MKTTITLKCYDQTLRVDNPIKIASGGLNENLVKFRFCSLWNGFVKTAIFYRNEEEVYHVLIENNCCVIPHEVTDSPGVFYIGVFGVNGGVTRTSEIIPYEVVKGAIKEGTKPSNPTPDIYTQILSLLARNVESTDEAIISMVARNEVSKAMDAIGGVGTETEMSELVDITDDLSWIYGGYWHTAKKYEVAHDKGRYAQMNVSAGESFICSGTSIYLGKLIAIFDANDNLVYEYPTDSTGDYYENVAFTVPEGGVKAYFSTFLAENSPAGDFILKKEIKWSDISWDVPTVKGIDDFSELKSVQSENDISSSLHWQSGGYYKVTDSGRTLVEHANYRNVVLDVIPGDKYKCSGYACYGGYLYSIYDNNDQLISKYPESNTGDYFADVMITIPANGAKMVINAPNPEKMPNPFILREITETLERKLINHRLKHKSMLIEGDSIARGSCNGRVGFGEIIAERHDMTITNNSVGGSQITPSATNECILTRIRNMTKTDYDFVVLDGGINDMFNNVPLGSIAADFTDSLDETTFAGAAEALCRELLTKFIGAKIVFILTHRKSRLVDGKKYNHPTWQDTYYDLLAAILQKWSIPCVDLRKSGRLSGWNAEYINRYFSNDGGNDTHPNHAGYEEFYVNPIENAMSQL